MKSSKALPKLKLSSGFFNLRELDLRESEGEDLSGHWLSHFPDACTLLESLTMSCLSSEVTAFSKGKELKSLSGFWDVDPYYLPVFYSVCSRLTFLNLSYATIGSLDVSKIISHCPNLQLLWRRGITMENQGQDGDAKTTLFNPEPAAETSISNECIVEEESEVEVSLLKSIAIKRRTKIFTL
nr:hypothetical protein [Tanacetum cinerariifolium]